MSIIFIRTIVQDIRKGWGDIRKNLSDIRSCASLCYSGSEFTDELGGNEVHFNFIRTVAKDIRKSWYHIR